MSGHSKWATTKHRKAAQDAKRSALFSKLSRNITVAAKEGGDPNPDNNASLAAAIEKAKGYSLPKDKIKTAIDKAFGSGKDAANYETVVYEGYGPAGIAVYCEALTDNRNRTAADVRSAFTHAGGSLGTSGSVAFQFERKGQIMIPKEIEGEGKKAGMEPNGAAADEDEFMMAVAEAGGDDYEDAEDEWIVYTSPTELMAVKKAIEEQGIQVKGAEMTMEPTTPTEVSVADAKKVMRLIDKLEELEDLQNVYHTMDITDEIAAHRCRDGRWPPGIFLFWGGSECAAKVQGPPSAGNEEIAFAVLVAPPSLCYYCEQTFAIGRRCACRRMIVSCWGSTPVWRTRAGGSSPSADPASRASRTAASPRIPRCRSRSVSA